MGFLENDEVFYSVIGYFGAKSKSHGTTMEKNSKRTPSEIKDTLWNKWIYSKKYHRSEFMQ